jgi:hypothetical protein
MLVSHGGIVVLYLDNDVSVLYGLDIVVLHAAPRPEPNPNTYTIMIPTTYTRLTPRLRATLMAAFAALGMSGIVAMTFVKGVGSTPNHIAVELLNKNNSGGNNNNNGSR